MIKVSAIIIAYNIQDYIIKCIESVVNQTLKDIEIIIVNDGSTDLTLDYINYMKRKDERIKIIDKPNSGASDARKVGFEEAIGEYVLFIDGDDWIESHALETLYNNAKINNDDIICYRFISHFPDGVMKYSENKLYSSQDGTFLELVLTNKITPMVWDKFIKRSFISENSVEFPSKVSRSEDFALLCSLGIYEPKFSGINDNLYYYVQRENSTVHKISNNIFDVYEAINFVEKVIIESDLISKYKEELDYAKFIHLYYFLLKIIYDTDNEYSSKLYAKWKQMNIKIQRNKYYKQLMRKETLKGKIAFNLFEQNYNIYRLYQKVCKNIY